MNRISFILIFVSLLLSLFTANVVNDDNYILFSDEVSAENSLPGADGTLYLIGSSIMKINLTDRSIIAAKKF